MDLPYDARQQLCARIEAVREQLVERVLADLYPNPFWDDRYGQRGRQLCREDNHYHLDFMVASIRLNSPSALADYYKWLQLLLVRRGMCTYHIRQNMDQMGQHLEALLPMDWPLIGVFHRAGYTGFHYDHPGCQALAERQEAIAESTTAHMYASNSFWEQEFGPRGRALCREDNLYHLSYLQDSLGADAPRLFGTYLDWLTEFLGKRGVDSRHIRDDLRVLGREITRALPREDAQPFLDLLAPHLG